MGWGSATHEWTESEKGAIVVAVKRELDFELCRQILFKLGELWDSGTPPSHSDFKFEGYGPENVSYNVSKLVRARLIRTKSPDQYHKNLLTELPTGFTEKGWRFMAAAKDENMWRTAVEVVRAQGGPESFNPVVVEMFRVEA